MANVKVNNASIEFKPPHAGHVNKTVSTTAVGFTAAELPESRGKYIYIQVQDQDVRCAYFGDPTASDGELLTVGTRTTLPRDTVLAMKFIRVGASDGKVFAQQFPA
jgi:hypothetical protein